MTIPDHIRAQAIDRRLTVTIRVGRAGVTQAVVEELAGQLESRNLVKAKLNRGLADKKDERTAIWQSLADSVGAVLVDSRGNVAVFWKS